MTTTNNRFDQLELEAFLGDFVDDYDIEAIIDEATWMDYTTGNRYWNDEIDLSEICQRHDLVK